MAIVATSEQLKSPSLLVPKNEGLNYLEQLTALAANCDSNSAPYLYSLNPLSKTVKYIKVRCGMWSCPECAIHNSKKWVGRIIDGCNNLDAKNWYLATITADEKWRKASSLVNIRRNWHKLRKRMSRMAKKQGEKLFYVRVWEHHDDGSYHMHVITNVALTTRWLKDNAHTCGLGYQAKMGKSINPGIAGGYVAKYMLKQSKEDTLRTYPKGARRIEASRNWVAWLKNVSEDDWQYAGTLEKAIGHAKYYEFKGYTIQTQVIDENKKRKERQNDKQRNSDESGEYGNASAGKLVTGACRRKTAVKREPSKERRQSAKNTHDKAISQNLSKRVKQPTIKDERILENDKNKT